jgi:hypothetical protein
MTEFDVPINSETKMTYSGLLMWDFNDFLPPFVLEAVEDRDVTFHQVYKCREIHVKCKNLPH